MRKSLVIICVALSLIFVTACGNAGTPVSNSVSSPLSSTTNSKANPTNDKGQKKDGFVVGFANGYIGTTWRTQYVDDFQKAAEKYKASGVIKDFTIVNSNQDVTKQLTQLNSMLNSGVDALLIDPVSATSLGTIVAKAKEKGVLVVITGVPAAYPDTYVVAGNNDTFFRIQTEWLASKLNGKGNIVEISGLPGSTADTIRQDAAKEVLARYPDIKVLASAPGKWSQTEAQSVMSTFLSTYKNIDAILEQDVMAEGVLRAYENANLKPPIMTGDYTFGFLRKWSKMPELETIGIPYPPGISVDALNIAIRLLQGKKLRTELLRENSMDKNLRNAINIDPPYVVTRKGEKDAPWLKGLTYTNAISLEEAIKLGEGQPDTAALDASLSDQFIDQFFK